MKGQEPQLLLADPPSGFREFPAGDFAMTPYRRLMMKLFWRYKGTGRAVWIREIDQDGPHVLFQAMAQLFGAPEYAVKMWSYAQLEPETLSCLIEPPARVGTIPPDRQTLEWRRADLYLTTVSSVYKNALIEVMAISTVQPGVIPELLALDQAMRMKVDAKTGDIFAGIPLSIWQLLVTLPMVLLFGAVEFAIVLLVSYSVGAAVVWLSCGLLLVFLLVLPRWRRQERVRDVWRTELLNGDNDGTIRRALASIGVELPKA